MLIFTFEPFVEKKFLNVWHSLHSEQHCCLDGRSAVIHLRLAVWSDLYMGTVTA